jgi:hypothetical protein
MIRLGGARAAVSVVAVMLVAGSLAGCSRAALANQSVPAAVTTTVPSAPASVPPAASTASDSSLQGVQDDLDQANSATSNAGGDVADADSSAATTDSP